MNGIKIKYNTLCNLMVSQLFYQNHIGSIYAAESSPDFIFMPSKETDILLKKLDLIFRKTDLTGGFTLLAHTIGHIGSNELLRFSPKAGEKLTFFLMLKNIDLWNYNDLPLSYDSKKIFYFSNQVSDPAALRTNLHLTKNASGVDANDYIKKSGEIYRYHHPFVVAVGSAKIKHLLTAKELDPVSRITEGGQSDFVFNLSTLPSGLCQLIIDGIKIDEFYYTGLGVTNNLFGVVELDLSSLLDNNYRIIESNKTIRPDKPVYLVHFSNRSLIWRYIIELKPNSPLNLEMSTLSTADKVSFLALLKLSTNDSSISFSQISATGNNIVFHSDSPLALKEKYISPSIKPLSITLKKYTGIPAKEAIVKSDLPYPSTHIINTINHPIIYSDIFLTL